MKYLIITLFLVLIGIFLYNQQDLIVYFLDQDWDALNEMMGQEWKQIILITFILMILQNFISFIPFLFLTMFNIWLYGFAFGYLWSLTGNFLGSVIVFYFARYGFGNWIKKFKHLKITQKIEKNGFNVVLFMRLLPFAPSSLVNIGSGLSNIKARDYTLATFFGNAIFVFVLSLFSVGLISLERQLTVYAALTMIVIVLALIQLKKVKSKTNAEIE